MPRISSATHHEVGAAARAPGFGMGWTGFDLDAESPTADVTLRPEQVIEGRLFDVKGRVIPGVRVAVEGIGHPRRGPEALPEYIDGPHFWGGAYAKTPPAWPGAATSDAEGRFTIRGIGRGLRVLLMADDPQYARQRIVVDTEDSDKPRSITAALEPAKVIAGRITYADTGKPVPHAAVEILAYKREQGGPGYINPCETDAEGYYRANPISGVRYHVAAYVPEGQPYMNATTGTFPFAWPKGAVEHRVDLALERGTVLRGKVVEEGSGRPVAGACAPLHGAAGRGREGRLLERHDPLGPGRLVPARRPSQARHADRPGPQRRLRLPGDGRIDGPRGQARRPAPGTPTPSSPAS